LAGILLGTTANFRPCSRPFLSNSLSSLDERFLTHPLDDDAFPLDDDAKRLVRPEVSSIQLRRAKIPLKNIDSNVFKALLALKKDPDRVVLSADKGNCVYFS
jgi:hypothetical protein